MADQLKVIQDIRDALGLADNKRYAQCPFHGGKDKNFRFYDSGSGVCYSQCGNKLYSLLELGDVLKVDVTSYLGLTLKRFTDAFSLDERVIEAFNITESNPKNKKPFIQYPYLNEKGEVVRIRKRYALTDKEGQRFAWEMSNKNIVPFNLNTWTADRTHHYGIIVEGETDVMALAMAGFPNTLGFAGASQFDESKYGHLIKDVKELYVWSEGDDANNQMLKRIADVRPDAKVLVHPDFKDPANFLQSLQNKPVSVMSDWLKNQMLEATLVTDYLDDADKREALKIHDDPKVQSLKERGDIFSTLRADASLVYAGNPDPVVACYISCGSRGMANPLHLYFQAPSSAGKTYTVNTALKFIAPEEKVEVIGGSEGSFVYTPDNYQDKVLYIAEYDSLPKGNSPIASAIRSLTSGGRFIYQTTKEIPGGREFIRKDKGGNCNMIVTGIATMEKQQLTRTLQYEVKHDPKTLRQIALFTGRKFSGVNQEEPDYETWRKISRLVTLIKTEVSVPFQEFLYGAVPDIFKGDPRFSRDWNGMLTAICSVAKIRASLMPESPKQIEATYEDYELVREVFNPAFSTTVSTVTFEQRKIYELLNKKGNENSTPQELADKPDCDIRRATVQHHLTNLMQMKLVGREEKGNGFTYHVADEIPDEAYLPTIKDIEALKENGSADQHETPEIPSADVMIQKPDVPRTLTLEEEDEEYQFAMEQLNKKEENTDAKT